MEPRLMAAKLGHTSLTRLATCHPDLVRLVLAYERRAR
jgi:hypothetical protein